VVWTKSIDVEIVLMTPDPVQAPCVVVAFVMIIEQHRDTSTVFGGMVGEPAIADRNGGQGLWQVL